MKARKCLSVFLALVMVLSLFSGALPGLVPTARAATNIGTEPQHNNEDVFAALGFDTSKTPEGYDADTTSNPYGRDKLTGNQVFEPLIATSGGTKLFGNGNNSLSSSDINGYSTSGAVMPGGMKLFAAATGDFDGDGLAGETAYVGISSIPFQTASPTALSLYIYDNATRAYSASRKLGEITPAFTDTSSDIWGQSMMDAAWQNLLQITAGDYDGDGIGEIAVYVAENGKARVDIYKYQKLDGADANAWLTIGNWDRAWSYAVSAAVGAVPNMVSLVSGDFNRDGVDDLGISYGRAVFHVANVSSQYIFENNCIAYTPSQARILWGSATKMLQSNSALELADSPDSTGKWESLLRVSLSYGDLTGTGTKNLIMTGEPVSDVGRNCQRAAAMYAYDADAGLVMSASNLIQVVDTRTDTLPTYDGAGNQTGTTTTVSSNNGYDTVSHSMPYMRCNTAVVTPDRKGSTYLYVDSSLLQYTEGQLTLAYELDDDKSIDAGQTPNAVMGWGMSCFRNSYVTAFADGYCEYGAVSGDINGKGNQMLLTSFLTPDGVCGGGTYLGADKSYAVLSRANEVRNTAGLYGERTALTSYGEMDAVTQVLSPWVYLPTRVSTAAAITLPDTDRDTTLIEYTGVHYLTYTDPKVLAIIAAAPYFEDVDIISDYDYAWQNTTSWASTSGSGHSKTVSVDFEVGGYLTTEFTVAGAKLALEASLGFTLEWEKETSKTYEYTLEFETSQDEDSVAFYCVPTECYVYRIYTPDGKGDYSVKSDIITNTFSPAFQILSLYYYESIQGDYDALPEIAGRAITSTPGDPSSYPASTNGYNVIAEWNDDPAGVSFGNGAITQEITITEEESEAYNFGANTEFKMGNGGEGWSSLVQSGSTIHAGAYFSLNPAGGYADVNIGGTTITGSVTNMPTEFQDYGYYYTWKLFSYEYQFGDGTRIPVVSYVVGDVSKPPALPSDFQQDYDRTTSDTNCLTWTYSGNASTFYLYKYYDFPQGGGTQKIAAISAGDDTHFTLKTDAEGNQYKEYNYKDENLSPYTQYQYCIQVERKSPVPPLSAPSAVLTARTKASVGNPVMQIAESDGTGDGNLQLYPDKNAYLTVNVTGPEGQQPANYYTTVQYQWQKLEDGAWKSLDNETSMTLTFASAGVSTAGAYRCRVNCLTKENATAITAYTDTVSTAHAKRSTYLENVYVRDVSGSGIELNAAVYNAHSDSSSVPGGTVLFTITGSTGVSYQYAAVTDSAGLANAVVESTLPQGIYSVSAYYSGSYIFKPCTAEGIYMADMSAGYAIDAPDTLTYGEGGSLQFLRLSKSLTGDTVSTGISAGTMTLYQTDTASQTEISGAVKLSGSAVLGTSYRYTTSDGDVYFFTATRSGPVTVEEQYVFYKNGTEKCSVDATAYLTPATVNGTEVYQIAASLPAGGYVLEMTGTGENSGTARASFTVQRREVTLRLPTEVGTQDSSGSTAFANPQLGTLDVVSGSWADCDCPGGTFRFSQQEVPVVYTNPAGAVFDKTSVDDLCGYYTMSYGLDSATLENYRITYLSGSLSILGATHVLSVGTRFFNGGDVGTVYETSPGYAYTRRQLSESDILRNYQTGTRVVLYASPDSGYQVYDWYVNGVAQNSTASSFAYVMQAVDTKVEVQFAVKQNTLTFGTAGDKDGGTLVCSDGTLKSGSIVLSNTRLTFTADAKDGYHFKEWRYTVNGSAPVYDTAEEGRNASTFEFAMPVDSCSLYAVFERDFYTLTLTDRSGESGLTASYMAGSGDSTAESEKVWVTGGSASIKGGTTVTVQSAEGYLLDDSARFVSVGSQGTADYDAGTYTLVLDRDTTVSCSSIRQNYNVDAAFHVDGTTPQNPGAVISCTTDGKSSDFLYSPADPETVQTIKNVKGGSAVRVSGSCAGYYTLLGWESSLNSPVIARKELSGDRKTRAVEVQNGGAVTEGSDYWYVYTDGTSSTTYYFQASVTGTVRFSGSTVTMIASGSSCDIPALGSNVKLTLWIEEKPTHTVKLSAVPDGSTYSDTLEKLPEGAFASSSSTTACNTLTLHEGDTLSVSVIPPAQQTITYWQVVDAENVSHKYRANALTYTLENVAGDFVITPIFASSTYNTVSWPAIGPSANGVTLTPLDGCLSSVAAGGTFRFRFTASDSALAMIDRVYANGNEFTEAGNSADGAVYTKTVENGSTTYTIDKINTNQVITMTFKPVGIEVNGTDISAFLGTGWTYDAEKQVLTITESGRTVSGSNTLTRFAPNLSLVLGPSVGSVIFDDLTVSSGTTGNLVRAERTTGTAITAVGSSHLTCEKPATDVAILLYAVSDLTVRGTGTLNLTLNRDPARTQQTQARGILCGGALWLTGTVDLTVSVPTCGTTTAISQAGGIQCGTLTMGVQNSQTSAPTLKVYVCNSDGKPDSNPAVGILSTSTMEVWGGNLLVCANTGLCVSTFGDYISSYGGTAEINSFSGAVFNSNFAFWKVDYNSSGTTSGTGFLVCYGTSDTVFQTRTVAKTDHLTLDGINGLRAFLSKFFGGVEYDDDQDNPLSSKYLRITPLSSNADGITVSVKDSEGTVGSGKITKSSDNSSTYYYYPQSDGQWARRTADAFTPQDEGTFLYMKQQGRELTLQKNQVGLQTAHPSRQSIPERTLPQGETLLKEGSSFTPGIHYCHITDTGVGYDLYVPIQLTANGTMVEFEAQTTTADTVSTAALPLFETYSQISNGEVVRGGTLSANARYCFRADTAASGGSSAYYTFEVVPGISGRAYLSADCASVTIVTGVEATVKYAAVTSAGTDARTLCGYTLSGVDSTLNITAQDADTLMLDSLTAGTLTASAACGTVNLTGSNYLTASTAGGVLTLQTPEEKDTVDLVSDGTGTLLITNSSSGETGGTGVALNSARNLSLKLTNVRSFAAYGKNGGIVNSGTGNYTVSMFDALEQGSGDNTSTSRTYSIYGAGWLADTGVSSAAAAVRKDRADWLGRTSISGPDDAYVSFYAAAADAAYAQTLILDHCSGAQARTRLTTSVTLPSATGKNHLPVGKVQLIGSETMDLTADTDYTWTPDGDAARGTLTLLETDSVIARQTLGSYTVRLNFFDENPRDQTEYTLEIPLSIINTQTQNGLSVTASTATAVSTEPDNVIQVGRGAAVSLTTAFTGTTPKTYVWTLDDGTDGTALSSASGAASTLTVAADAAFAQRTVTVESYSGTETEGTLIGKAAVYVRVVPTAESIAVTCAAELPASDGSYTLLHNTEGASWTFDAAAALNDGSTDHQVAWSLWGATLQTTTVNSSTGEVRIAASETGTKSAAVPVNHLELTAAYHNLDGTTLKKTVLLYLSTNAKVSYTKDGINGTIASVVSDSTAIAEGGTWIPENSIVTAAAAPAEGYTVKAWYVNGKNASEVTGCSVSQDGTTLTLTAEAMGQYVIRAEYLLKDSFAVTFLADANGTLTAAQGNTPVSSGERMRKGTDLTLTAAPNEHYQIRCWYVDNSIYRGSDHTVYTGTALTLSGLQADHTVRVEFEGIPRTVAYTAEGGGSLLLFVNGTIRSVTPVCTGDVPIYQTTVNSMSTVSILANPDSGYQVKCWDLDTGNGYEPVTGSEETASYRIPALTGDVKVKAEFEAVPKYDITIGTANMEAGGGTVTNGIVSASGSGTASISVDRHSNLSLMAIPEQGSEFCAWRVNGVTNCETTSTLTLEDIRSDAVVSAVFRKLSHRVTLDRAVGGSVSAAYELPNVQYSGRISAGAAQTVRAGSRVTVTLTPDEGMGICALRVNGSPAPCTAIRSGDTFLFTYTVPSLQEDLEIEAEFEPATVSVRTRSIFTDGDATQGRSALAEAPADSSTATVVPGGTVTLTFTPEDGYTVDVDALLSSIQKVLKEAENSAPVTESEETTQTVSEETEEETPAALMEEREETSVQSSDGADYRLYLDGSTYAVELRNITASLDFSGMDSPFATGGRTRTVSFSAVGSGTITAGIGSGDAAVQLVSGASVPEETPVTFAVSPASHFTLSELKSGTDSVEGEEKGGVYTYTEHVGTSAMEVTAVFTAAEYLVTVSGQGTGSGTLELTAGTDTLSETGYLPAGTTVTAEAWPDDDSEMRGIYVGGKLQEEQHVSFQLDGDRTVTAVFDAVRCRVDYVKPAGGTLTVTNLATGSFVPSGTSVPVGTKLSIAAQPDTHYALASLSAGGTDVENNTMYTVAANKTNTIAASFRIQQVPVSWTNPAGGTIHVTDAAGTALASGTYVETGSILLVSTVPLSANYQLKSLAVSGANASGTGYAAAQTPICITAEFQYIGDAPAGGTVVNNISGGGGGGMLSSAAYTVMLNCGEHGTLCVKNSRGESVKSGDSVDIQAKITIEAQAETGYELASLTVNNVAFTNGEKYEVYANTIVKAEFRKSTGVPYYLDEDGGKVFLGFSFDADGNGKFGSAEFIAPAGKTVLTARNAKDFTDVQGNWAADSIQFVTERELFLGTASTTFSPDAKMTRAMFATVLGRLYERSYGRIAVSASHPFDDCDHSAYYDRYVDWAAANGIVTGYDEHQFGPNDWITRAQMAVMVYRFAEFLNILPGTAGTPPEFSDADAIGAYARTAAAYCQETGIMTGKSDGTFAPGETVSRAQVAAIFSRLIQHVIKTRQ